MKKLLEYPFLVKATFSFLLVNVNGNCNLIHRVRMSVQSFCIYLSCNLPTVG